VKIKIILVIAIVFSSLVLNGCALSAAQLGAITTPEAITDSKYSFTYDIDNNQLTKIINTAVKTLDWKKLEEHHNVLLDSKSEKISWELKTKHTITSEYVKAWSAVSPDEMVEDLTFIKIRTPMSMFSFGAEIFIGVSSKNKQTTVKYSGSTTQIAEKDKIESYLTKISSLVTKKALQHAET